MTQLDAILRELESRKNPVKAKFHSGYFKTGKGEYGAGDTFLGITVPEQRRIARAYIDLAITDVKKMLESKVHEHRFTALEILVAKYKKSTDKEKKKIVNFYLKNRKYINNWDLVDTSARFILGDFLLDKDKSVLYKLAKSKRVWDRRIAIISTHRFIYEEKFENTLRIAKILNDDTHDLIHKAVGWMLREVGNKSLETEEKFLKKCAKNMPRTMLRYAIEKFPPGKRNFYLSQ